MILMGLVLLAIGSIMVATAVWKSHTLPKWSGIRSERPTDWWLPLGVYGWLLVFGGKAIKKESENERSGCIGITFSMDKC